MTTPSQTKGTQSSVSNTQGKLVNLGLTLLKFNPKCVTSHSRSSSPWPDYRLAPGHGPACPNLSSFASMQIVAV
eukprot:1154925-Pelagomonas_calceolata.AAC.6